MRPRSAPCCRFGCAIGQGWYLGKPMPADEARDLLLSRDRAPGRTGFGRPLGQRLTISHKD